MKPLILKLSAFLCVGLLITTAITSSSCKKEEKCHGLVTVVDTSGIRVGGATVLLDAAPVGGQVSYTGVTDANGQVEFEIKLPAIVNITATHDLAYPGMTGRGTLRVDEPGKKADVTVKIQP